LSVGLSLLGVELLLQIAGCSPVIASLGNVLAYTLLSPVLITMCSAVHLL
jgi:hypothetical protein